MLNADRTLRIEMAAWLEHWLGQPRDSVAELGLKWPQVLDPFPQLEITPPQQGRCEPFPGCPLNLPCAQIGSSNAQRLTAWICGSRQVVPEQQDQGSRSWAEPLAIARLVGQVPDIRGSEAAVLVKCEHLRHGSGLFREILMEFLLWRFRPGDSVRLCC